MAGRQTVGHPRGPRTARDRGVDRPTGHLGTRVAQPAAAPDRHARRAGTDEPPDRRAVVPVPPDRRHPPLPTVPEAGHHLPCSPARRAADTPRRNSPGRAVRHLVTIGARRPAAVERPPPPLVDTPLRPRAPSYTPAR